MQPAMGFTGHIDIVPLGEATWRHDPFAGETDGDLLYGRGSSDMKSGVAAMVVAARAIARDRQRRAGIELVLTAGEETGCSGAREIVKVPGSLGRVGALVVGEPTDLGPRLGHRGVIWIRLRFKGRTAHASMPHEGDNAVLKAARAAVLLSEYDFDRIAHPALGRPTLNVGRLEGGLNLNSVPTRPSSASTSDRSPDRPAGRSWPNSGASCPMPSSSSCPTARHCGAMPAPTGWRRSPSAPRRSPGSLGGDARAVRHRRWLPDASLRRPAHGDPRPRCHRAGAQDRRMVFAGADRAGGGALYGPGRGMVPLTGEVKRLWLSHARFAAGYATDLTEDR